MLGVPLYRSSVEVPRVHFRRLSNTTTVSPGCERKVRGEEGEEVLSFGTQGQGNPGHGSVEAFEFLLLPERGGSGELRIVRNFSVKYIGNKY